MKIFTAIACIALCVTAANAKSIKFSDVEKAQHGGNQCEDEINRAKQVAQDAASFDKNGKPKTPTAVIVPGQPIADHRLCEQWEEYVRKTYLAPGN
jgi:hypothetical protein